MKPDENEAALHLGCDLVVLWTQINPIGSRHSTLTKSIYDYKRSPEVKVVAERLGGFVTVSSSLEFSSCCIRAL